jgi:hypothetical protein
MLDIVPNTCAGKIIVKLILVFRTTTAAVAAYTWYCYYQSNNNNNNNNNTNNEKKKKLLVIIIVLMNFYLIFHRNPWRVVSVDLHILMFHMMFVSIQDIVWLIFVCVTVLENLLVCPSYIAAHEERISSEYSSKKPRSSYSIIFMLCSTHFWCPVLGYEAYCVCKI